jgi:hypothetical protein
MKIAIVGSSASGLAAARSLSADHRHSLTVLETAERLNARRDDVDVWVNGLPEAFDVVLIATSAWEASALLQREQTDSTCITLDLDPREAILQDPDTQIYARPGITTVIEPDECRCVSLAAFSDDIVAELIDELGLEYEPLRVRVEPVLLDEPLPRRVYFAGSDTADAIGRMAADHPEILPPSYLDLPPAPVAPRRQVAPPRAGGLSRLTGRLSALVAAPVELIDLSGQDWSLGGERLYVANHHSIFDSPRVTYLKGLDVTVTAAREAALEALSTNAPIVPIAAYGSDLVSPAARPRPLARLRRQKLVIVIGEPFHPETSSVDELLGDIRAILLYLEDLARAHAGEIAGPAHAMAR